MDRRRTAAFALATLTGTSLLAIWIGGAHAQEPSAAIESQALQLRCHIFRVDTESALTWETTDRTTEIGQWVGEQEDGGWRVHDVDFEVGQKATGYPQGYVQVCMHPA